METSTTTSEDGAPGDRGAGSAAGFAGAREDVAAAARWFVGTVGLVAGRWDAPGLGEWDVRALVGHTSRSLLTVEAYLDVPAARVDVGSPEGYLVASSAIARGPEVADRGRAAGAALGPDPAAAVAGIAERVLARVARCDGTEPVTTVAGGMRLADYLPTRTLELVVHTLDLHVALGLEPHVPPGPAAAALALVARTAAVTGRAAPLLLAATGRRPLPDGYTVL